jgi:signal transduction histidine kinase
VIDVPVPRWARRLWPQKVRARLTVLYALLFLVAGASLLALTYGLVAGSLPAASTSAKDYSVHNARLLAVCKQQPSLKQSSPKQPSPKRIPDSVLKQCKQVFAAGASAASQNQRDQTLGTLLLVSLIGLGVVTIISGGLGWIVAGRVLAPIRTITETARRASELHLGDRLALTGPADELKELADTFDEMLERLDAAFASQKRFVANAAHELRTPLTAMRTTVEVTLSKPERTPEQLEAMATRVRRSIERAEATIDALLTLAVSERGPASHELVDLATATEDALDAASAVITRLQLTVDTTLEPVQTSGDPVLLERMIANLVDNAVRHNHPGGSIQVRTGESNGAAFFGIANTGPFVPEATLPSLVEPFGRAEQRSSPAEGVGLGLSIATAISAAHGATLITRSRPAGGLEVSIALPRSGGAASAAPPPEVG